VIAGEIPMSINPASEVIGQIEGGTARALRSPPQPARQPFRTSPPWPNRASSVTPAGTALVAKSHDGVAVALNDPIVIDYLAKVGSVAVGSTADAFEAITRAETDKRGPVVKAANIKQP